LSHGQATGLCRTELEAWLRADRRHRGALLRAQAALSAMETAVLRGPSVLASDNDPDYGPTATPASRRPGAFAITAVAACLLAVMFIGPAHFLPGVPGPTTSLETLDLADGSSITLGDGAEVTVQMTDHAR